MAALSHVKSNTVGDFTGTVTVFNSQGSTVTANATDLVRPGDWNSAHNFFQTISGNTAGQSTASGTNLVIGGTDNITVSMSTGAGAATLWIDGGPNTINYYPVEPVPVAFTSLNSGTTGATGGSTQGTASLYIRPFVLTAPLAFHEVELVVSGQATSAGTGSATHGYMLGVYTNNASTLSQLTSYQWVHHMSQNSVTAQSHTWYYGTDSNANSSSASGNISATYTRVANIRLNNSASTFNPGTYYLAVAYTNRTSSVNVNGFASCAGVSQSLSTGGSYFGAASLQPPLEERFFGVASATMNAANSALLSLPASIASTQITKTGGSSQWFWPNVRFYNNQT